MKWSQHLGEGYANLFSSKLRSLLALLGILVGTASVVAMVMGGKLATNEALKQFKTLGTDLLAVSISDVYEVSSSSAATAQTSISLPQAKAIKFSDKQILDVVPYIQVYNPMQFNGHAIHGSIMGVTENFANILHIEMQQGRFISDLDNYGFFCVVGQNVYNQIKATTVLEPIGQQIQVDKNIFTIVGVAKTWPENNFLYSNVNNAILVPILSATILSKYATINNVIMHLKPGASSANVQENVANYLTSQLGNKNLYFRSAKELVAKMSKQSEILTIFLGLIGGISLIVGGIGVMNIMLVSVVERRREIGIRLAVGATPKDIRSLFLIEAVMLSMLGGFLGVVVGITIAYIIAWFSKWQFSFFILPPLLGFTVSAATGVFFGFYPAHKAAKLDPIQALRSD